MSVELVADISRLRSGLNQGIQLINRFSQQATRSAQAFGTGFQKSAQQVQSGAKFMGREYNRFAVGTQAASAKVTKAVQTQTAQVTKATKSVGEVGAAARKTKPKMDEFAGGILNITRNMGKWIAFNLSWFLTWRLMWTALRWVKAGVSAIIDFDTAITNLGAITGATQAQLISLEDTAREVGATTRFTAVQVAEAMVDLSKAGFSVAEVNQMIAGTALLAIGTLSDMTQTTQLVATTLRTFHLQASEAARIANVFAAAITSSRLTIESLRASMKYIGPIMAEIGYTIEDTAAVLGVLSDRGLEAGISARGLRGFFSALIAPTAKLRKELESVGLSVRDVSPLMNDLAVILSRLEEANFDVESAMRGLERRVGTTAIALISAGKYFEVLRDAVTATTAASVIAERQMGSLGYRLILLRSQATELALDFRDVFLPAIRGVLGGISALIVTIDALTSRMVKLLNVLPPVAREFVIFGGIFAAITLAVGIFSGGVVKGVGLLTLFAIGLKAVGATLLKVIGFLGPWGVAIAAIGIGLTVLVSRLKKAHEETTTFRKEVAASLVDLSKQRTELARVGIALGEYRDDEIELRTALEGLADTYSEIRILLMKEKVTYEDAIAIVNKLTESKTEEARVRREELIKAIEAEIEAKTREIDKIEELAERIRAAWPVWKQLLQIWHLIRFGTLDSAKAIKELENEIRVLESSQRALTITTTGAKKEFLEYTGTIEMTAKELLELAKIQKLSARELLPLYDAAIARQWEMRDLAALVLRDELNALTTRKQAQVEWSDAITDPAVAKAYGLWIKQSQELTKLEMERADVMQGIYDNLESIREAEERLMDARAKGWLTEEKFQARTLNLMQNRMRLLIENAKKEEKWTKENAEEYIKAQQTAHEAFTKLLELRLQAALTAGKSEMQALLELQATFEQWGPLFETFASKFYEEIHLLEKLDKEWVEDFLKRFGDAMTEMGVIVTKDMDEYGRIIVKGTLPVWEGVLEKIRKVYEEYSLAMLEFDINVGRERREVLIAEMRKRLADEAYWQGKTYEARNAFEMTIVKLYQTTNKEIIAEAKELAKIDIALGFQVLTERLKYLKEEAKAYPILTKEIFDARKDILPDLAKLYKKTDDAILKVQADTVDEVVALATKENREKIELLEAYLQALDVFAKEGIDIEKDRDKALDAIRKLRILSNKIEVETLIELRDGYYKTYKEISAAAIEDIRIMDEEAYQKEREQEEKRYLEARNALGKALAENVLAREQAAILWELLAKVHNKNLRQIEIAHLDFLAEFRRDSDEKREQALADRNIQELIEQRKFYEAEIAQANETIRRRLVALDQELWERNKLLGIYHKERGTLEIVANAEFLLLEEEFAQRRRAIVEEGNNEIRRLEREQWEYRRRLAQQLFDYQRKIGVKTLDEEIARQAIIIQIHKAVGRDLEEIIEAQAKLYDLLIEKERELINEALRRGEINERIKQRMYALWVAYYRDLFKTHEEFIEWAAERWEQLIKDFDLVGATIEERWGDYLERMKRRIETWFTEISPYLRDLGEIAAATFTKMVDDFAEGLVVMMEGMENMWHYWQKFWQQLVAFAVKELMKLIAKKVIMLIIQALGTPIPVLGGGGEVAEATTAGPGMELGGTIKSARGLAVRNLQNFQKGGEVLIAAHAGEYVIPRWMTEFIKKTRSIPEQLIEGIAAGTPPRRYQEGGEVTPSYSWTVQFMPGSRFTAEDKLSTRAFFEQDIWPLIIEHQRRGR